MTVEKILEEALKTFLKKEQKEKLKKLRLAAKQGFTQKQFKQLIKNPI